MPRPSSISQLPPELLEKLQECLRDPRVSQLETTEIINQLLEAEGIEQRLSKSAVNRYAQRMERVGEKIRESREVAKMWMGKLGATPQTEVGNLINELYRTISFDIGQALADKELDEENMPGITKMLKELSLTALRLERAANFNVQREKEIRQQEREEAARKIAELEKGEGRKGEKGLDQETLRRIRQEVYGIVE